MKISFAILCAVFAVWCATLTLAQPTNARDASSYERDTHGVRHDSLGKLAKADKIIGMEVSDANGKKVGKVKDLAIDLQNGRVVEVIVGTGGMLSLDEQYVAIPPGKFAFDATAKSLRLKVDRAQVQATPSFKLSNWESNVREANITEVYQYYRTQPYFGTENQSSTNQAEAPARIGEVQRATKLFGTVARDIHDESAGKVVNLIVDLPAGRVVEVILASGGFMGFGQTLCALPPQSFHLGVQSDILALALSKRDISRAPHFKSSEWPDLNNRQQIEAVYRAYNVEPYFNRTNAADETSEKVRDRADNGNQLQIETPTNQ